MNESIAGHACSPDEDFRRLVEATSDVVYRMSRDWGEVHRLFARGMTIDEALPRRGWLESYVHPADRPRAAKAIADSIRSKRVFELEHRVQRADGSIGWVVSRAIPLIACDGEIIEWFGAATDVTARRRSEDAARYARASANRDELRRKLSAAEENERGRLARELHDSLGQHMTAFVLGLAEVRRLLALGRPVEHRIAQLDHLAAVMARDTRYLALELRPPELDDVGLESALETYVEQWRRRYGVDIELAITANAPDQPLSPSLATALYRIVQEALANVAKHAAAKHVTLLFDKRDDEVRLVVEDDGRGFDLHAAAERMPGDRWIGIAGMRERSALVGATFDIETRHGGGTTLYVRAPLSPRPTT